jgi:hypothetical protein
MNRHTGVQPVTGGNSADQGFSDDKSGRMLRVLSFGTSVQGDHPVLAALPSQFAAPIICEVESLLSDAPLRIRVDGLESRRSYAET